MRNEDKFLLGGCAAWAVGAILYVAFWVAVIYVALHFIGKYW